MDEVVPLFGDEAGARQPNSAVALDRLRSLIEQQGLVPGRQLPPERQLAVELGVGRRALRRALEVLEAEGLLVRIQGSGTFIGRPARAEPPPRIGTETDAATAMEARLEIEPVLARLAALRADAAAIEAMRQTALRLAAARDDDGCELWDGALHRQIAKAAGNKLLLALFEAVDRMRQNETWRAYRRRARSGDTRLDDRASHLAIIEAIAAGDGQAAEAAMRSHLTEVGRRFDAVLAEEGLTREQVMPKAKAVDGRS